MFVSVDIHFDERTEMKDQERLYEGDKDGRENERLGPLLSYRAVVLSRHSSKMS